MGQYCIVLTISWLSPFLCLTNLHMHMHATLQFYGKRKSSFYGKNDSNKKRNSRVASVDEDYQGPTNTGYFVWKKDEVCKQWGLFQNNQRILMTFLALLAF